MNHQETFRLQTPQQELEHSSFFECTEPAIQLWLASLPMANIGETTRRLFNALNEFNKVRLTPAIRMNLLENLRTPIYYVSQALAKHYLNQTIVLPPQAKKVAHLAYTLHQQLATGYTIVASHASTLGRRAGIVNPNKLIAKALHRAITDHTLNMQRHYQLYEAVDDGVWHNLHQFYCLARQHKILNKIIEDKEFEDSTVEGSYIRALLIGSCKPNQLRQEDFMGIFKPLTYWADMCRVVSADMPGIFVIDTEDDSPPIYRELYDTIPEKNWLSLDTSILAMHLKRVYEGSDSSESKARDGNYTISQDLLGHLKSAWSVMSKRTFMRMESPEDLYVCVGLTSTHHFVSGELSFDSLTEKLGASTFAMQEINPFMKKPSTQVRSKDVWDSPYEANLGKTNVSLESIDYTIRDNSAQKKNTHKDKYHSHKVHMINSSSHGYCIKWPNETMAHIKTGEIVGIKQLNSHNWSIGVIRWVTYDKKQQIQLGIELISPSASPYGAKVIQIKGSQSEYARALLLPEISAIKRPVTLLLPKVLFRAGQKILLNQRGKEVQIMLRKKLNDTGAYSQFEFSKITSPIKNKPVTSSDDSSEFDSLWNNL